MYELTTLIDNPYFTSIDDDGINGEEEIVVDLIYRSLTDYDYDGRKFQAVELQEVIFNDINIYDMLKPEDIEIYEQRCFESGF